MNLSDRRELRALMEVYGVSAQKKYGQNFLTDDAVLDDIVSGAGVCAGDTVLEIGPGLGTLTRRLAAAAGRVIAVEIDNSLIPVLRVTLGDMSNVEVINADILKCDIRTILEERGVTGTVKVVANLPYYITTPIVMKLLEQGDLINSITIMVQKEVAVRMQSGPGSKDYGALSLAVQYYSEPVIVTEVAADCFYPSPAVDSAVIRLDARVKPPVDTPDEKFLFDLIRATFNMRRKTLPNALSAGIAGLGRDRVEQALDAMGLPHTVRGETFTLADFATLSSLLYEK